MAETLRTLGLLSVVVPLYREGTLLTKTITECLSALNSLGCAYELILVDDGSPDNTWQLITEQCMRFSAIKGIRLSRNFGKEAALAAGLDSSKGDAVIVMDGDLQHPPALIPAMVRHWQEGADVVDAVKQSRGQESLLGKIRARSFYWVFSRLTGHDLRGASDFKLMDCRALDAWRQMGERNLFFRGMSAWTGFNRVSILFDVPKRSGGTSGWSTLKLSQLALTAVTAFSSAPLHLISLTGVGFMVMSLILGAQTLYLKISNQAVDGFTTVILLLLVMGGAIMLGLGIIGTYIARIYDEVKARPRYIVAEQVSRA